MAARKKKSKARRVSGKPLVVVVSIDAQGRVTVSDDPVTVKTPGQRIRWKLDPASQPDWRLDGFEWCGEQPPPKEFHTWDKRKDRISVTDRNKNAGEWRYGLRYNRKGAEKHAPSMIFDPVIRNEPPH
jgi:hypothetical protein